MTLSLPVTNLQPDLGARGVVALLTPAENPTAEPELSVLLPPDVNLLTMRMHSPEPSMKARLQDYGRNLERWMTPFGDSPLDAVAFACTGTNYLLPAEARPSRVLARPSGDCPLVAAATALESALLSLGACRIILVSPYPDDLTEIAVAYWRSRGFEIMQSLSTPAAIGGHPIYSKTAASLLLALQDAFTFSADAIVAMGTGAPSLPALAVASLQTSTPILSSNLCTAWSVVATLKGEPDPVDEWLAPDAPWRARLAARFPTALERLNS